MHTECLHNCVRGTCVKAQDAVLCLCLQKVLRIESLHGVPYIHICTWRHGDTQAWRHAGMETALDNSMGVIFLMHTHMDKRRHSFTSQVRHRLGPCFYNCMCCSSGQWIGRTYWHWSPVRTTRQDAQVHSSLSQPFNKDETKRKKRSESGQAKCSRTILLYTVAGGILGYKLPDMEDRLDFFNSFSICRQVENLGNNLMRGANWFSAGQPCFQSLTFLALKCQSCLSDNFYSLACNPTCFVD